MPTKKHIPAVGPIMTEEEIKEFRFPSGVLRADLSKQMKGKHWLSTVRYYYEDYTFTCRDCGKKETWTTQQQKQWYEDWNGDPNAIAVRCRPCRTKQKTEPGGIVNDEAAPHRD